jgi:hypothetical protein
LRPYRSAADRTRAVTASRIAPSPLTGLNRCSAAVSQPYCCIHLKCVSTVCWSQLENSAAGWPLFRLLYADRNVREYSRTSGHALIALLAGDGGWPQLLLQCHHPLMGEPSPPQANQPW